MRAYRFWASLATTLAVLLSPLTAVAASDDPWEFEGGGWGHGVGLSQFGAFGQAQEGRTPEQILQFYYQGTDVESMPNHWTNQEDGLWVGLVSNTTHVRLGKVGDGEVRICQPSDCSSEDAVDVTLNTTDTWHFETVVDPDEPEVTKCRVRRGSGPEGENWGPGPCDARITQPAATGTRIVVNGDHYARGTLHLTPTSSGFHVVLGISMEKYLYGLAEVPSSWPAAALQAQAIIGRSYALATAHARGKADGSGKLSSCGCHIRDTTADQAYVGWSKEAAPFGAQWREAVDDTAGQILTHPDSASFADVATAYYSSSNGGASENNEDVWGGTPLPWLRSVADAWSSNPDINPLATWSVKVSDADLAAYFGWDRALDAFVLQGPPDVLVRFTGKDGGSNVETILNGTQIAAMLNIHGFGYQAPGSSRTIVSVSPYIKNVIDPPGFDDTVGHTFELAIEWMLDEEITVGCNPPDFTNYCPGDPVTRGQMAVFISRVMNLPPPTGDHFNDDAGQFYESAANRLFEAGITVGCDDNRFCGDRRVSREQMAAFIVRAVGDLAQPTKDYFVDDNNSIFQNAINTIAEAKITVGCNPPQNNWFCPSNNVTRGQMAAFFIRTWGS